MRMQCYGAQSVVIPIKPSSVHDVLATCRRDVALGEPKTYRKQNNEPSQAEPSPQLNLF